MPQPVRRRLPPDQRRAQILACAVRLFGQRPYSSVSTTEVARQAGVARGLVNHYFGTKRDLYLEVVRRMVTFPEHAAELSPAGSLPERVDRTVAWFLDVVARHPTAWLAAVSAQGADEDPELARILAGAEDTAADRLLQAVGIDGERSQREELRAVIRPYGALVTAAAREWLVRQSLSRDQVRVLLTTTLLAILRDALPAAPADSR